MTDKIINDKVLGQIILRHSVRAKRYSIHIKEGQIFATIPRQGNERMMHTFINEQRSKLLTMLQKNPKRPLLNENTELQTQTFQLHIFKSPRAHFYATLKEDYLHIACPESIDFNDSKVQDKLYLILRQALQREAMRILPVRLKALAELHRFRYNSVTIRNTKTRWGSCSSIQNINLSLSLMLLPTHLIDYVLLHELCHTIEMNHSSQFWLLMDKVTNGLAKAYRRELKTFRML